MPNADVYQMVTDRIISMLEKGVAPWRKPWTTPAAAFPRNLINNRSYQGINVFLLGTQGYDSPYWLTFKQAHERGCHVRKGEKGSLAVFYKTWRKKGPDENGEEVEKSIPVLRYYTVFNACQCEGIDAPAIGIVTYPENERIASAEAVVAAMPNAPSISYGGNRAFYQPSSDSVTVPEIYRPEKPQEYYSTLFHELTHSTGHASRLNREGITGPISLAMKFTPGRSWWQKWALSFCVAIAA